MQLYTNRSLSDYLSHFHNTWQVNNDHTRTVHLTHPFHFHTHSTWQHHHHSPDTPPLSLSDTFYSPAVPGHSPLCTLPLLPLTHFPPPLIAPPPPPDKLSALICTSCLNPGLDSCKAVGEPSPHPWQMTGIYCRGCSFISCCLYLHVCFYQYDPVIQGHLPIRWSHQSELSFTVHRI